MFKTHKSQAHQAFAGKTSIKNELEKGYFYEAKIVNLLSKVSELYEGVLLSAFPIRFLAFENFTH